MITFLLRVLGLRYPSTEYALNHMSKPCVRVAADSYVVKGNQGFADGINTYLRERYYAIGCSDNDRKTASELRKHFLEKSTDMTYPCVVWFSPESVESLPLSYDQSDAYGA